MSQDSAAHNQWFGVGNMWAFIPTWYCILASESPKYKFSDELKPAHYLGLIAQLRSFSVPWFARYARRIKKRIRHRILYFRLLYLEEKDEVLFWLAINFSLSENRALNHGTYAFG